MHHCCMHHCVCELALIFLELQWLPFVLVSRGDPTLERRIILVCVYVVNPDLHDSFYLPPWSIGWVSHMQG